MTVETKWITQLLDTDLSEGVVILIPFVYEDKDGKEQQLLQFGNKLYTNTIFNLIKGRLTKLDIGRRNIRLTFANGFAVLSVAGDNGFKKSPEKVTQLFFGATPVGFFINEEGDIDPTSFHTVGEGFIDKSGIYLQKKKTISVERGDLSQRFLDAATKHTKLGDGIIMYCKEGFYN